jgi:hypothetical protein
MASENSTGGTTSSKREAAQVMAEVGGVRSSDDPVPDHWFGQPTGERRDATCSAEVRSSEGRGDGPRGLQAPDKRSATANHAGSESVSSPAKELGKPDAGKPPVRFDEGRGADGHWSSDLSIRRFPPTLHPAAPCLSALSPFKTRARTSSSPMWCGLQCLSALSPFKTTAASTMEIIVTRVSNAFRL